jgi:hypothetical protein
MIAAYHKSQLRTLLEHVRAGFSQLDSGEIDEFDMDDLFITTGGPPPNSGSSADRAEVSGSRPRSR